MLTRCPKCKHRFFLDMMFCPHCGLVRQPSRAERRARFISFVLAIVAVALVAYLALRFRRPERAADTQPTAPKGAVTPRIKKKPVPPKEALPRESQ